MFGFWAVETSAHQSSPNKEKFLETSAFLCRYNAYGLHYFSIYIIYVFLCNILRFFARHFKCKFNYTHMLRDAFQDGYCINVIFIIAFLCICNFYGFSIYIMCFYICTKAFSHDI